MLSPGIGQVTHALLTRPPLTWLSLGFKSSPFDLHVLGTPPAFILSQDQTLMLKSLPASLNWLSFRFAISGQASWTYCFWVVTRFRLTFQSSICSLLVLDTIYSHLSEIIQSCLNYSNNLFSWNLQGCITVYLSRYFVVSGFYLSATTFISYHISFRLSTTFFIFFQLFSSFRSESAVLPDNECEYSTLLGSCQHLLLNFFIFLYNSSQFFFPIRLRFFLYQFL